MALTAVGADEKKKLMFLGGLLAAIVVVVVVLYLPKGKKTTTPPIPPAPAAGPEMAGAPPGGLPGAGASMPKPVAAAPGGISVASLVSVEGYRPDPFSNPLPPPPLPIPPPPPPKPVVLAPPLDIAPPGGVGSEPGISLPPATLRTLGAQPISNLPLIIPRRVAIAPTAPRLYAPPGGQSDGGGILTSQNKRLSGVIIGDSVRALLEISNGDGMPPTTRVVQPGDEVDGIRILRLERVSEGGRTVTRLIVRENNQEQYVELRPAPQQQNSGEGGLGLGGPSMPGMPGAPGGLPAPNPRF